MDDTLKTISSRIKESNHVVAFTGAGISAECGISTYRGPNGLWNTFDPNRYANISYFLKDPTYYWNFFREVRYPMLKKSKPGQGHLALAEMEVLGYLEAVITQNIDGLHQDAGSSSVVELHGTTRIMSCMGCSRKYTMEEAFDRLKGTNPPLCAECQGKLRPDVVFFGEALDPQTLASAYEKAEHCDFLLVVGSSLVVYPAAAIPQKARQNGAFLAIINKEETALDHEADAVVHAEAGRALPQIIRGLKKT